jgi:hypothetical protein
MARIIKPPAPLLLGADQASIFLAGSIEMGAADNWQREVENTLDDLAVVILNPRREEWDASCIQSIDNPQFRAQVEWELEAQERASVIGMYFAPATRAPITLLELGLFARSGKLIVCCPAGFWRKGNIEVVSARYGVPLMADLTEFVERLRERIHGL